VFVRPLLSNIKNCGLFGIGKEKVKRKKNSGNRLFGGRENEKKKNNKSFILIGWIENRRTEKKNVYEII